MVRADETIAAMIKRMRAQAEKKHGKTPEELYEEREARVRDAINLRQPDRVPVAMRFTYFPATYTRIKKSVAYYDAIAWRKAVMRTVFELEPDVYQNSAGMTSGLVNELLGPTQSKWPGGPLPDDSSNQAVDVECMKADEYDLFLNDPTGFTIRYLLPRAYDTLAPLSALPDVADRFTGFSVMTPFFRRADFRAMARALLKAGAETDKWRKASGDNEADMAHLGFPQHGYPGGAGGAPFDMISDFYRGMRGAMIDMYRAPDKLLAACDKLLEWRLSRALPADPTKRGNPKRVFIALHRGAEGFMSKKQFETFYWPGLKKAMLKSIELGFIPAPFCEGRYLDRVEYFLELPKGKVIVHFDQTDMFRAKEILGDHCCIMGNVPSSLLQVGSPSEVDEYCAKLIKVCGKGGGFILTNGSSIDEAKPANIKAMIDSAKKHSP